MVQLESRKIDENQIKIYVVDETVGSLVAINLQAAPYKKGFTINEKEEKCVTLF